MIDGKNNVFPKLNEYYKSEVSSKIFSQIDAKFSNLNHHQKLLNKILFYQIFFFPICQDYPDYKKVTTHSIYFSSLKNFVEYELEFNLEKEYTSKNKILITVNGKGKLNKGKLHLMFKLDRNTRNITSVIGEIVSFKDHQEYKMNIELYELD